MPRLNWDMRSAVVQWRKASSARALCTGIVILLKMQTGEPVCPGTKA